MVRSFPLLLALLMLPAAVAHAAQTSPRAAANADLPTRLGELLRQLDYDQSRKLTRQIEPAQSTFTGSDLATAVASAKPASASAVLVVGRRGPLADSPLEIEQTFAIPAEELQPTLQRLERKARTRSAYVPRNAPDGFWTSMLSQFGAGGEPDSRRMSQALSTQGSAAFLFVMQQQRVQKIILIPDTVKITVSGNGSAPPPQARPMPMRPDSRRPLEMPPDYPMPEPPPEPEPVEAPSDESAE